MTSPSEWEEEERVVDLQMKGEPLAVSGDAGPALGQPTWGDPAGFAGRLNADLIRLGLLISRQREFMLRPYFQFGHLSCYRDAGIDEVRYPFILNQEEKKHAHTLAQCRPAWTETRVTKTETERSRRGFTKKKKRTWCLGETTILI